MSISLSQKERLSKVFNLKDDAVFEVIEYDNTRKMVNITINTPKSPFGQFYVVYMLNGQFIVGDNSPRYEFIQIDDNMFRLKETIENREIYSKTIDLSNVNFSTKKEWRYILSTEFRFDSVVIIMADFYNLLEINKPEDVPSFDPTRQRLVYDYTETRESDNTVLVKLTYPDVLVTDQDVECALKIKAHVTSRMMSYESDLERLNKKYDYENLRKTMVKIDSILHRKKQSDEEKIKQQNYILLQKLEELEACVKRIHKVTPNDESMEYCKR